MPLHSKEQRDVTRGIVMVMITVALFAISDAISKYLTRFYPVAIVPARIVWTRFCNSGCLSDGISLASFEG